MRRRLFCLTGTLLAASLTATLPVAAETWSERCAAAAPSRALQPCEEALIDDPLDLVALKRLGDFYLGNRDEWKAVELYEQRLALEPENGEAWFDHAAALATMWYFADASPSMHRALALEPERELYHRLAVVVFEQSGEPEAAFRAHRALAEAGVEIGMYDLARDYHYGRGTAVDGEAAALWYRRAAEAGHVGAMAALAEHLPYGALGEAAPEEAERWRREAEAIRRSYEAD